jgi:hypothetical protein
MTTEMRDRFLAALETAFATLGDVAKGMGQGYRTLQAYRLGERRVTTSAARKLVSYLRARSAVFAAAADELEDATREEEDRNG